MKRTTGQARQVAPKVVVIVLNWNGRALTAECLDSLQKVTYPNFEAILVDNASTDGSQQFLKELYPRVTLLENEANLGFAAGNNVGIREALRRNSDYVLLLNNDTVVDPSFLSELVKAGEADRRVGILNPKIYYHDRPNVLWYAGGHLSLYRGISVHFGFRQVDSGQYDTAREVNFLTGCAFLIKRQVIEKIGLLDEIFFCYSEDADWSLRAIRAGYKGLYVPSSMIRHKIGVATKVKGNEFGMRMGTRNAMYMVYKHARTAQFLIFLFLFSINWILRNAVKSLLSRDYATLLGLYKGITGFFSMVRAEKFQE